LLLDLDESGERINALAWFEMQVKPKEPDTVYVQIGALAVQPQAQRKGFGADGLELIKTTAAGWARRRSPDITLMRLSADVHVRNEPCIALISARDWSPLGKPNIEKYQQWGAAYRIQVEAEDPDAALAETKD
jgi:GNAT superfamily N-acetyltransferase